LVKIFAVAGKPIMHSMSPPMQNAGFRKLGLECVYTRIAAPNAMEALNTAMQIGMSGINVTAPFKEDILRLSDSADKTAKGMGASNTLLIEKGKTRAYNVDGEGVVRAFEKNGISIKGKNAVVLGAGGAAMAAAHALAAHGAKVTIANRTLSKAMLLAKKIGCGFCALEGEEFANALSNAQIVVSTLSTADRVIQPGLLGGQMALLDAVYAKKTALSTDAEKLGIKVIDGKQWLLWQGVAAFELFTKKHAPAKEMEEAIRGHLKNAKSGVALVGFMGSGKTSVAQEIAKSTGMEIIDTDAEIVRLKGMEINEIFAKEGEAGFRKIEKEVIAGLAGRKNVLISCGGGAILDPANVGALDRNNYLVWLFASPGQTLKRLEKEKDRPLLNVKDRLGRIAGMLGERMAKYASSADVVIGTDNLAPEEIANLIMEETGLAKKHGRKKG